MKKLLFVKTKSYSAAQTAHKLLPKLGFTSIWDTGPKGGRQLVYAVEEPGGPKFSSLMVHRNRHRPPAGRIDRQAEKAPSRKASKAGKARKNPCGGGAKKPTTRSATKIGRQLVEVKTTQGKLKPRGKASVWGLPDGSIFLKGFFTKVPKGTVKRVDYLDEAKAKREGLNPPNIPWRHNFTQERKPLTRTRGGLLIKAGNKPLWGKR